MRLFIYIVAFFNLSCNAQDNVEQPAEFPGGIPELIKFINKNKKYPSGITEGDVGLIIQTKFVIDTNGKAINISIEKPSGNLLLDLEAIRLIKLMPAWSSAKLNGKSVLSYFNYPITFKIKENTDNKARNNRADYLENYEKAVKLFNEKDYVKSKESYLKAAKGNSLNVNLLTNLGTSYFKLDKKDSACYYWNIAKNELISIESVKSIKEYCK